MGKRTVSLKTETIVYSIILLCITTLSLTFASAFSFSKTSKINEKKELKQNATFLKDYINDKNNTPVEIFSFLKNFAEHNDKRITLISANGGVLYETNSNTSSLENHINRKEIQDALTLGEGYDERKSATFSTPYIYYATKCSNNQILRVSSKLEILSQQQKSYILILLPSLLILCLVMIVLSFLVCSKITKPINSIIKIANEYNKGNFNSVFSPSSISEINSLQNTLSNMAESINSQIKELSILERMRKDFVANVSHELKTPLTAIEGFTEILLGQDELDDENSRKFLEIIYKNSARMENIVKDLLLLSSLECSDFAHSFEKVRLGDLIEEVINSSSYKIEKSQDKLICNVKIDNNYELTCHKGLLVQAISNLLSNAVIYSPLNSTITLNIYHFENYICFTVIDNGIGIDRMDIDRIFERFYRVDKSRSRSSGGTGLGLSIVKHVAEIHGGKTSVYSDGLGKGSKFTIYIPK